VVDGDRPVVLAGVRRAVVRVDADVSEPPPDEHAASALVRISSTRKPNRARRTASCLPAPALGVGSGHVR
jgi:hypothetical protein